MPAVTHLETTQASVDATPLPDGAIAFTVDTLRLYRGTAGGVNVLVGPVPQASLGRLQRRFDWGDVNPLPVGTVPGGRLVTRVELYVETAFSDAATTLSVGTAGDPAELLPLALCRPTEEGLYETAPCVEYLTDTEVVLGINRGGGEGSGGGLVVVLFEP